MSMRRIFAWARLRGNAGRSLAAALLMAAVLAGSAAAIAACTPRVLVLHSYHQGLPWTDGMQQGISRVFADSGTHVDQYIHYLDTARQDDQAGRDQVEADFLRHVAHALHPEAYDLVLTTDNDALTTVLRHRDRIAPGAPVVFCGVNNFSEAMLSGQTGVAGVPEFPSFDRTLDLARTLLPGLRRILVLGDDTDTGAQNEVLLRLGQTHSSGRLSLEYWRETDIAVIEKRLAGLGPDWAVLLMCRPFDGKRLLSVQEAGARVSAASPVPVLTVWDIWMGHGPLGGVVVSAQAQGEAAARMALGILEGEPPAAMPVRPGSPNVAMLDRTVLDRFGIPEFRIPSGASIIHERPSVFRTYRSMILASGILGVAGFVFCLILILNVLRRRRAESGLKRQLLFTETLLRAMPVPVFYKDGSGCYLGCNQAFEDMSGLRECDVVGKSAGAVFPGEKGIFYEAKDREILECGGVQRFEYRTKEAHGLQNLVINKAIFCDENGKPAGIVGMVLDVTQRRMAEERLALAIAGANDGIWDWDRTTETVYYSPRWKEIIGYDDHEIANSLDEWIERIHPEDRDRVLAVNNEFFSSDETHFVIEYRMLHKDGTYRWILGRGTCVRDADGMPYRMAGSHADITERKEMERELVEARDEALTASRAKNEFLANMSHEIRTPLNGMLGMLHLLEGMRLTPEQQQYVRMAASSAKRLTGLLSDILDLSRIECGRLVMEARPFTLSDVLLTTHELFSMSARRKGVRLDVCMGHGLPEVLVGDELRLRQILFNLVGNATKFVVEGFVRVNASSLGVDPDGRMRLLFCVEDSGPGIGDGILADVFEPFSQGEDDYVRQHQGAGLGLAIVKRLVLMMEGSLAVESSSGGTTICVSLPFVAGAERIPVQDEETADASRPLKILLAEDDAVSMFAVRRILEKAGHEVECACDGLRAVEMLHGEPFDLILMDVQMPNVDGLQATRLIRGDESLGPRRAVPIVAMTAYAMSGDRKKFLDAGMDDYVAKPVNIRELERVISSVGQREMEVDGPWGGAPDAADARLRADSSVTAV